MVPIVAATPGRRRWATERATEDTLTAAARLGTNVPPAMTPNARTADSAPGRSLSCMWLAVGHEVTGGDVGATILAGDSSPPMSRRNGGYESVISDE